MSAWKSLVTLSLLCCFCNCLNINKNGDVRKQIKAEASGPESSIGRYIEGNYVIHNEYSPSSFEQNGKIKSIENDKNSEVDLYPYDDLLTQQSYPSSVNSVYGSSVSSSQSSLSSPALSAIALLGFIYLLNLIQNVLENANGRKKREIEEENDFQGRSFNFWEAFLNELPSFFTKRSDDTYRDGGGSKDFSDVLGGLTSFFGSRIKMVSSIFSFLRDPDPLRIKRAAVEDLGIEEHFYDKFIPLGELLVSKAEESIHHITKRFTHGMNAWYGDPSIFKHQNKDGLSHSDNSLDSDQASLTDVIIEGGLKGLMEMYFGVSGSRPKCLQKLLCRLNSKAQKFSFGPKFAVSVMNHQFAGIRNSPGSNEDNLNAIEAGLTGEDCSQTFASCVF